MDIREEKEGLIMRSILHEQRNSSLVAALITIVVGLLLVFWPDLSVSLLCTVLGIASIASGVVYIIGWVRKRRMGQPAFYILPGVILCALGLWLVTRPASVVKLIQYIFGAILIFHGVVDVQGALSLMRQHWNRWWLDMLLAAATAALGLVIILNPFGTFAALAMITGFALIFDGVSDLFLIHRLSSALRDWDDTIL